MLTDLQDRSVRLPMSTHDSATPGSSQTTRDPNISPETLLHVAPNVRTRFDAAGHVLVDAPDGTIIDIGRRGTRSCRFSRPRLSGTRSSGSRWSEQLDRLRADAERHQHVDRGRRPRATSIHRAPSSGWADPVEHARMLHDDRRTGEYLAALGQAVRPGDVVLDIGTGSGVLAIAAARAGARHVYAVEASDIAEVAERVFAVNDMADRITLVAGWSRQIELPEPPDLLVSEVIGNEPFEEEILETTLDARCRLLKPGARRAPNALTLFARPLAPGFRIEAARPRTLGDRALARAVRYRFRAAH